MKKQSKIYWIAGIIVLALAVLMVIFPFNVEKDKDVIKIGIVTDLTGAAAYWGESTRVGAELARQDLRDKGFNVKLFFEDYQLEATRALTSAQKLINIDGVDSIYAEFNPAAISVGSFLKDKEVLYVYNAAVMSPLDGNSYAYKTYLDYKEGCRQVSEKFKEQGVDNIGVLKVNMEFGELCLEGVREVYGENTYVETYNLGDQDIRTQVEKLNQNKVRAIINVGFAGDTLSTLKTLKERGLNIKYGTVDDTITKQVIADYQDELIGSISFGFSDVSPEFIDRISGYELSTPYGAALSYTHIMQIGKALGRCKKDMNCVKREMDNSLSSDIIGFRYFINGIADLDMNIIKR